MTRPSAAQIGYNNPTVFAGYERWDDANPDFYRQFQRFTLELLGAGRTRVAAAWIFERIRWESLMKTQGEPFKLNNSYRAIYARRFMFDFPNHDGVFELRGSASNDDHQLADAA
jgi:hypothetical protein